MMMSENNLRDSFIFGIATAGFQIEGGYNGSGEPANNWCEWEALGKVEPSGVAVNFWNDYEAHLDRVVSAGCNSFRLSIEWARCEPKQGIYDEAAFTHYAKILDACISRGLIPLVSLMHFTTPAYLGTSPWLSEKMPSLYAKWAKEVVSRFGDRVKYWVTLNEPNIFATMSYFMGMFPPGTQGKVSNSIRALDNQMAGHVLAYNEIKKIQPNGVVSYNNFCFSVYELDRAITDIMLARSKGVKKTDLGDYLSEAKARYYQVIPQPNKLENLLRKALSSLLKPTKVYSGLIEQVYKSESERPIDVIQIDFYNPLTSSPEFGT